MAENHSRGAYGTKSIVLVSSGHRRSLLSLRNPNYGHFFPESREQTYRQMLQAFGFHVRICTPEQLLDINRQQLIALVFTCDLQACSQRVWQWLTESVRQQGILCVADIFLSNKGFYDSFGIENSRGYRKTAAIYSQQQTTLYAVQAYPYAEHGFAMGVRPVLRYLLQNRWAKNIHLKQQTQVHAHFSNQTPAIISRKLGRGNMLLCNFQPALVFKDGGQIHAFFKHLLRTLSQPLNVTVDLSAIACLRLDDPGSCERAYLQGYDDGVVSGNVWRELADKLSRRNIPLNIAYVPQWVDDGMEQNGALWVNGQRIQKRQSGKIYKSWQLRYQKRGRTEAHDYAAEYQALKHGVQQGVFHILSHGLTHLSTHVELWLQASDKYRNKRWYREFREMATKKPVSKQQLLQRLQQSREYLKEAFSVTPGVFVPSAHEQTESIPALAGDAGFLACSSRATFFMQDATVVNRKIKAFYASERPSMLNYIEAGYPVVFTCHDYDLYRFGADWMLDKISELQQQGVRNFYTLDYFCALFLASVGYYQRDNCLYIAIRFPCAVHCQQSLMLHVNRAVSGQIVVAGMSRQAEVLSDQGGSRLLIPMQGLPQLQELFLQIPLLADERQSGDAISGNR